jgi:positive regulator of sigma E activity
MLKKIEFSKLLLLQESILIWIMSLTFLVLAFFCIWKGYMGSLPWLAAMVAFPWTAYGVSQAFYYKKAMAENTKDGIKYESIILEAQKVASQYQDAAALDVIEEVKKEKINIDQYRI